MYRFSFLLLFSCSVLAYFLGYGGFWVSPFIPAWAYVGLGFPLSFIASVGVFKLIFRTKDLTTFAGTTLAAFIYTLVGLGVSLGLFWSWEQRHTFLYIDNGNPQTVFIEVKGWGTIFVPANSLRMFSIPDAPISVIHADTTYQLPKVSGKKLFFNPHRRHHYVEYQVQYGEGQNRPQTTYESVRPMERPRWFVSQADILFKNPPDKISFWGVPSNSATRTVLLRVSSKYIRAYQKARKSLKQP